MQAAMMGWGAPLFSKLEFEFESHRRAVVPPPEQPRDAAARGGTENGIPLWLDSHFPLTIRNYLSIFNPP